jgi:hypothetical protein
VRFLKAWGAGGVGEGGEGGRGCFVEVYLRIPVCDGGGLSILAERFSLVRCLGILARCRCCGFWNEGPKWERAAWVTRLVPWQRSSIFQGGGWGGGEEGRGLGYEVLGEDGVEDDFCVEGEGMGIVDLDDGVVEWMVGGFLWHFEIVGESICLMVMCFMVGAFFCFPLEFKEAWFNDLLMEMKSTYC